MKFTVDDIIKLHPCSDYTPERIFELWAGRKSLYASEILALDIPINDRGWCLGRLCGLHDPTRSVARKIALDVIDKWNAPKIVRRYLETGDESIRAAAWDAARDAAWDAAWDAARAAARAAARDAAWATAWDAAWDAARAAARAAARDAARDAARQKYCGWMAEFLDVIGGAE